MKGECKYSEDKCWFKHQSISKENTNKTETIENIANEEITERVLTIENNQK